MDRSKLSSRFVIASAVIVLSPISVFYFKDSFRKCSRSMKDSDGFFCFSNSEWTLKKEIFKRQEKKQVLTRWDEELPSQLGRWWQENYEPNFSCAFEERIGNAGDGGKWVCDPYRIAQMYKGTSKKCLVLSFGSSNQFGFEEGVIKNLPNCEIHTFDHTMKRRGSAPREVIFHRIGLSNSNTGKLKRLDTIMKKLKLQSYTLELLKVDIERAEWDVFIGNSTNPGLLFQGNMPYARQILIELHITDVSTARLFFTQLTKLGYVITHKEPNTIAGGILQEYNFMKTKFS